MAKLTLKRIKGQVLKADHFRIVFLGDSITSTEWVHPNWREIVEYVLKEQLAKLTGDWRTPSWNVRGINSGFDGATTQDLLNRLENDVLFYQPKMVICIAGDNDVLFGINPNQHQKNVKQLVAKISKKVPHLIFATSTPANNQAANQKYAPYVKKAKELFPQPKTQFINLFEIYQQFDLEKLFTFKSDGNEVVGIKPGELDFLHPNQLGNAYIAKVILEEGMGISFNPELYIQDTLKGLMYPHY